MNAKSSWFARISQEDDMGMHPRDIRHLLVYRRGPTALWRDKSIEISLRDVLPKILIGLRATEA